jgi:hypothetical protein
MNKKPNYVECHGCKYQIEQNIVPDRDWAKNPCPKCHNTRRVVDPREILCNLCGECARPLGTHNEQYSHGLEDEVIIGGYDSYHLFDMTSYTFTFCEKCLRNLFNQCKIPPAVDSNNFDGGSEPYDYAKDREEYEYRLWKDNGGHHQAYLDRKCNFVKDCSNKAEYTQIISNDFTEGCCCEEHKELWGYGNSKLTKFIPNVLKPFL